MTLASDLSHFTGTENYYRHGIVGSVVYTDGVKHFANTAGAHWFLDILATEVSLLIFNGEDFVSVKMDVTDGKAVIWADDGNGKALWNKRIGFTDCPNGEWRFYMAPGGPENTIVIMLPSEY
jgi:hypothetical protein